MQGKEETGMTSLLKSTRNTRLLPAGDGRFLRSDVPLKLEQQEVRWLRERNFCTLVDLRSEEEALRNPCALRDEDGFTYLHLPVTGGGDTPRSREHLHQVYRQMLDSQMETIIQTILKAPTSVMYFCTAGKDRTGVVSAVLLRRLGIDDETIVKDYMQSKDNLMDMLISYVQAHPQVDLSIIVPQEENIRRVLDAL
ncbi:MAG: tyrosine-protein phosphatase [Clostridiales bacterium]|nr:tyrosine-protein phosphatase [Clostridiales bacterium]